MKIQYIAIITGCEDFGGLLSEPSISPVRAFVVDSIEDAKNIGYEKGESITYFRWIDNSTHSLTKDEHGKFYRTS